MAKYMHPSRPRGKNDNRLETKKNRFETHAKKIVENTGPSGQRKKKNQPETQKNRPGKKKKNGQKHNFFFEKTSLLVVECVDCGRILKGQILNII